MVGTEKCAKLSGVEREQGDGGWKGEREKEGGRRKGAGWYEGKVRGLRGEEGKVRKEGEGRECGENN